MQTLTSSQIFWYAIIILLVLCVIIYMSVKIKETLQAKISKNTIIFVSSIIFVIIWIPTRLSIASNLETIIVFLGIISIIVPIALLTEFEKTNTQEYEKYKKNIITEKEAKNHIFQYLYDPGPLGLVISQIFLVFVFLRAWMWYRSEKAGDIENLIVVLIVTVLCIILVNITKKLDKRRAEKFSNFNPTQIEIDKAKKELKNIKKSFYDISFQEYHANKHVILVLLAILIFSILLLLSTQ